MTTAHAYYDWEKSRQTVRVEFDDPFELGAVIDYLTNAIQNNDGYLPKAEWDGAWVENNMGQRKYYVTVRYSTRR